MPTLAGMRRRGYPPAAIRDFCERVGVTKKQHRDRDGACWKTACARTSTARAARDGGARPAQGGDRELARGPGRVAAASCTSSATTSWRTPSRSSTAWRRAPRCGCARLRHPCEEVVKDAAGAVVELRCTSTMATARRPNPAPGARSRASSTGLSAAHGAADRGAAVRPPVQRARPGRARADFLDHLNPGLLEVVHAAPSSSRRWRGAAGTRFQFERLGYFCRDQAGFHARCSRCSTAP
jgi:glutaminyl-tRNA synthetase